MPGLGSLLLKGTILAVKFYDDLCEYIKLAPNKLSITKKHINLNSEIVGNSEKLLSNLPELEKNLTAFRPKTYIKI